MWICKAVEKKLTSYRDICLEDARNTRNKIMMLHNSVFMCLVCKREDIFWTSPNSISIQFLREINYLCVQNICNLPKFRKIYSLHSNINLCYILVMCWYSIEVSSELSDSVPSALIRFDLFDSNLPDFLVFPCSKSRFKSNSISVLLMICW